MKKLFAISTGIFIGIAAAIILIHTSGFETAYGQEGVSWWNNMVAKSETLDFGDTFSALDNAEKGKDLYDLVYKKLERDGEKKALRDVAGSYGLTLDEADAVLGGSIAPIFNNQDRGGAALTQEDAYALMAKVQEDYELMSELFQTQQEIEVAIKPSEIFANDDLSDSGFDLIHDLSVIEEVLFLEFTPSTIGAPYEDAIDSPYDPTRDDQTISDYVASGTASARLPLHVDPQTLEATLNIGDEEVEVEILENDVCPADDPLNDALNNLEEEVAAGGEGGAGADGDDDTGGGDDEEEEQPDLNSKIQPAPVDQWLEEWCPGLSEEEAGAGAGFSADNLRSLGGAGSFAGAGASANVSSEGFSANIGLCLDLKLVRETLTSYQPGDSCIACEVEKITGLLEKTLDHTLVPNKVTGNLLESAKCKKAGTLINLQFITIWNPIPTPPNDDLIFGKNIFEEWNKFTERYQPLLFNKLAFDTEDRPELSNDFNLEYQSQAAPPGVTQSQIFDEVNATKAKYTAQAEVAVEELKSGNEATDMLLYSKNVLLEMRQMNALFENFNRSYQNIVTNAIPGLCSKGNVD